MAVETDVLFVRCPAHLAPQLLAERVPFTSLRLSRGASVLCHPRRMRTALQALDPDVVITSRVGYLGAALRAGGFRGPIVGVEHGELIELHQRQGLSPKGWVTRTIGAMTHDAEVAVSRYMVDLVSRGVHVRRIVPISLGVDPSPAAVALPPWQSTLHVGYVGRLYPGKGVDRLIRAIARLAHQKPASRVELLVAGDGEMRGPWTQLARELGVADQVQFVGWTDNVREHWARCHVAVAPNDTFIESFGMSVLEAMEAGRATIVTDRGALPELIVPGQTGEIVAAGDEAALADALAAYAADPGLVVSHGAAARQRAVAAYSLTNTADQVAGLARDLLEESTSRRRGRL